MANGDSTPIHHIGNSLFYSPNSETPLFLHKLLHVPHTSKNLLSVSQFAHDNNVFFEFHANSCYIKSQDTKQTLLEGKLRNGLYAFDNIIFPHSASKPRFKDTHSCNVVSVCNKSVLVDNFQTWHARLGHASPKIVALIP